MRLVWKILLPAIVSTIAGTVVAAPKTEIGIGLGALGQTGFLQTPAGGQPETATPGRPTLDELAVDAGHYRWLAAGHRIGRYRVGLRYTAVGDSGRATVSVPATIQGQAFPAGSETQTQVDFDELSVWVTRQVVSTDRTMLEVGPWIGWTGFDLQIDSATNAVDRTYRVYAVGAYAALRHQLSKRWHVGLEGVFAPGIPGAADRGYVEPSIGATFGDWEARLALRDGRFQYDDAHKQTLPNRLWVERSVAPALGVRWRF